MNLMQSSGWRSWQRRHEVEKWPDEFVDVKAFSGKHEHLASSHPLLWRRRGEILTCLFVVLTAACCVLLIGCEKQGAASGKQGGPEVIKMTAAGTTVSVVAVGDILLGSAAGSLIASNGYDWPFDNVRPLLGKADLVVGNLAAPITSSRKKAVDEEGFSYKMNLACAAALHRSGFHAMSVGNAHILDFGTSGMRETISVLRSNGMASFGAGKSEAEARRGIVYDFGTLRIGLLAYGEDGGEPRGAAKGERGGFARLSEKNLKGDIAQLKQHADVVVVSVHWGKNYKDATEAQHKLGRKAVELGADIVCGHHPHVAQGIEIYKGKPIIYSLGNFVFGTKGRYPDKQQGYGLVTRWVFEGKSLKWVLTTPIGINNELVKFQPTRIAPDEARIALEPHLQRYGTKARWEADTAFVGVGGEWHTAALPLVPWTKPEKALTGTAVSAGGRVAANP